MPGRDYQGGSETKEKFTGRELDSETGLDYFGARYYWSAGGRWWSVDPLAEKHPEWSSYNYVLNNPIFLVDPDGRQVRSDSPGRIYTKVYERAAKVRLQKYGYADPLTDPRFQRELLNTANTYGPTTLDALSLVAMGFGQFGVAAGLSWVSVAWTSYLSYKKSNPDGIVAIGFMVAQGVAAKKKEIRIGLQTGQILYDIYLSGVDYRKPNNKKDNNEENNDFETAAPDNTRVNNSLLQSVAKDLGWITVDWNEIRERFEQR